MVFAHFLTVCGFHGVVAGAVGQSKYFQGFRFLHAVHYTGSAEQGEEGKGLLSSGRKKMRAFATKPAARELADCAASGRLLVVNERKRKMNVLWRAGKAC